MHAMHVQVYPAGAPGPSLPAPQDEALADMLMVQWVAENREITLAHDAVVRAGGAGSDDAVPCVVDVTQYSSWFEMPTQQRYDVQPFCMHPRLLQAASLQVVPCDGSSRCARHMHMPALHAFCRRIRRRLCMHNSVGGRPGAAALWCCSSMVLCRCVVLLQWEQWLQIKLSQDLAMSYACLSFIVNAHLLSREVL
jgi:hypothetical protein